eukprot:scaffold160888_cov48-Prasinocladus_malaysianus.AAC.1
MGSTDTSAREAQEFDGSPLAELQAAAVIYDALVKVRSEVEGSGLMVDPEERTGQDWNQSLTATVTVRREVHI